MPPDKIEQNLEVHGVASKVIQIGKFILNVPRLADEKVFKRLGREQRVGFALIGVLVIAAALGLYLALRPHEPVHMTGDFRIAVAGFAEKGQSGNSRTGTELAQGVFLRLEQTAKDSDEGFTITVWGPDKVGDIRGQSREERAAFAEQLAKNRGADIVVYGMVEATGTVWQLLPEFYVSSENFYEAGEIVGQHEMGMPLALMGQSRIVDRIKVSDKFTSRVQALSKMIVGLAHYSNHDYERALVIFQSAERVEGWEDNEGKQVLYLLIGNAAGKNGMIELAETYYRKSRDIDPEYARAYIGLANVYYRLASRLFEKTLKPADIDPSLIEQAIATYR